MKKYKLVGDEFVEIKEPWVRRFDRVCGHLLLAAFFFIAIFGSIFFMDKVEDDFCWAGFQEHTLLSKDMRRCWPHVKRHINELIAADPNHI